MGSAFEVRNLGELIEKPGKQKGRWNGGWGGETGRGGGGGGGKREWGVMCYDRIKQNV